MSELENELDQVIVNIGPQDAFTFVKENFEDPNFVILDVRTPKEFSKGHIEGAVNMDFYSEDFREQLEKQDREKKYLICCGSGVRGVKTLGIMQDLGFTNIFNILGEITMWKAMDLPLTEK
jgi:rhodanese-related sulfurtransferase